MTTEPSSDQPLLRLEMESEIQQRIAALPPPLQESFVLRIVRGISVKGVAAQLGLSSANVRKRVQLARVRLRRDLRHLNDGDSPPKTLEAQPPPVTPVTPVQAQSKAPQLPPPATVIRTARVMLPCGVEQLFHVFPAKPPVSPGRKIKTLQSYLDRHPGSWRNHLALAELFYLTGDWIKAIGRWQRALAMRPHLPAALKLGDTLLKFGEPEAAADVFSLARRREHPSSASGRHLDGWIAFCQKDAARSAMEFQAAADLEPDNPAHWHGLALARHLAGKAPEALAAIERALNLNPDDLPALSISHDLLLAAGRLEEAIRSARRLLTLAPLDLLTLRRLVECRCQLGLAHGAAGTETRRLLGRALRLSRNPLLMREPLAQFFLSRGQPQKALTVHSEFAERHPQCPGGRQDPGRLPETNGLPDRTPPGTAFWKSPALNGCNGACYWQMKAQPRQA